MPRNFRQTQHLNVRGESFGSSKWVSDTSHTLGFRLDHGPQTVAWLRPLSCASLSTHENYGAVLSRQPGHYHVLMHSVPGAAAWLLLPLRLEHRDILAPSL
jgi:hypothetical protein